MVRHSPHQQYKEACQIARDHGCFVIERGGFYMVYRRTPERPVYLGKRSTAPALRRFVCQVTNFH